MILHGTWSPTESGFSVWAEQPENGRKPRGSRTGAVTPHPFAAPADSLSQAVTVKAVPFAAVVRLPVRGGRPLPSPELLRVRGRAESAGEEEPGSPAPWKVPAVRIPPAGALDWLAAPAEEDCVDGGDL